MYDPPGYLWVLTIGGVIAFLAATCVVLYGGAVRAGLGRRRAALLVARGLARGAGDRAAVWFNAFGMTDLVLALALGAVTAYELIHVTPSGAPLSELPLALVPTVGVPLLLALHITSVSALARAPRTPAPAPVRLAAATE
jgi:hypothetical protein